MLEQGNTGASTDREPTSPSKTTRWATSHAQSFGLTPQGPEESDAAFRDRISGQLRNNGQIIEAHEAYQDALFDENGDVQTGILGAVAQMMKGVNYGTTNGEQVGDDIASGVLSCSPRSAPDPTMVLLAALLSGGNRQ